MTQVADWPGRDEIAARAAQRWHRRRPFFVVLLVFCAAAAAWWGWDSARHDHYQRHHSSTAVIVVVGVVAFAGVAGVIGLTLFLLRRRGVAWRDPYAAPITLGLPRAQRREVLRAIRRGIPSADPTLCAVERESAERLVQRSWTTHWSLLLVVPELVTAFAIKGSAGSRVVPVVLAALCVPTWAWSLVRVRGAKRLLAASRPVP